MLLCKDGIMVKAGPKIILQRITTFQCPLGVLAVLLKITVYDVLREDNLRGDNLREHLETVRVVDFLKIC